MFYKITNSLFKSPPFIILLGYVLFILAGAVLLNLNVSHFQGGSFSFVDSIFTSASAITDTGLIVKDTSQFSRFGQTVILFLMQIGGIGIMTSFAFIFVLFKKHFKLPTQNLMKDVLDAEVISDVLGIIKFVTVLTLIVEFIGVLLFYVRFKSEYSFLDASFYSIFHSVSTFVSAGFTLFSDNFIRFQGDLLVNFVSIFLIIFGTLGFVVYLSLKNRVTALITGKRPLIKITLGCKIILASTFILLFLGTVLLFFFEADNLRELSSGRVLLVSLFQSASARTAGFNTIDMGDLTPASRFLITTFMFIGGAPGSMSGGIKITVLFLIFLAVFSFIKQEKEVVIWGRTISVRSTLKAFSIFSASVFGLVFLLVLLLIFERFPLESLIFELTSAFGNSGLSMGISSQLSSVGKIVLVVSMLFGRLGPLTLFYFLIKKHGPSPINYPEERVVMG